MEGLAPSGCSGTSSAAVAACMRSQDLTTWTQGSTSRWLSVSRRLARAFGTSGLGQAQRRGLWAGRAPGCGVRRAHAQRRVPNVFPACRSRVPAMHATLRQRRRRMMSTRATSPLAYLLTSEAQNRVPAPGGMDRMYPTCIVEPLRAHHAAGGAPTQSCGGHWPQAPPLWAQARLPAVDTQTVLSHAFLLIDLALMYIPRPCPALVWRQQIALPTLQ